MALGKKGEFANQRPSKWPSKYYDINFPLVNYCLWIELLSGTVPANNLLLASAPK